MLSLPVFLRVFFLRALCCVFLRSLVPAGNQAGAGAGLPGSSRYAPAHGIAVARKVCPVRIFTAKETAVCAIFSYICRMKITILGPAHPYRGGLASIMEIMARTFQRRGYGLALAREEQRRVLQRESLYVYLVPTPLKLSLIHISEPTRP